MRTSLPSPTPLELPRVTVCTVTYNRRPLLPLLQSCLLAQDYPLPLLEWVIVDDSTGGALPDLEGAREAGIRLLWHELPQRLPLGAKRNLANDLSTGEVIVVMDDDDFYPSSRIRHAVEQLRNSGAAVAGCDRLPLLLLPEGNRWFSRPFGPTNATANSLAYTRHFLEEGHRFNPEAEQAEEPSFLANPDGTMPPLLQLNPFLSLICIGHGSNTVDKRTWIAAHSGVGFEPLPMDTPGFPGAAWLARYREALRLPSQVKPEEDSEDSAGAPHHASPWRVAVITPYHTEPLELIHRCHDSVRAQTVTCVHMLVADGPGRPEVLELPGRHIVLGMAHSDNTPRSIGALAAMNEGFDCIAFLDADNWLRPDHLERAIATQEEGGWDVVFSNRHIVFPDGQRLITPPAEDMDRSHADTSCMVIFAPAFASLALWAQMPQPYGPICDRLMFSELMARHRCGWTGLATLYFETWYVSHFLAAGRVPPLNAKFLPCQEERVWAEAAIRFRQRSATPVYPGAVSIAPAKPRLNLISILGAPTAGGDLLQWHLSRHFSFCGIRENQFLWHWLESIDADHRARHSGAEILAALAKGVRLSGAVLEREGHALPGMAEMLQLDRHYTPLEAYFRVLVALTPPEALTFSHRHGVVNVLDRSTTLPLAADLLFRCLPLHRALLVWRDPISQVAAWRSHQGRPRDPELLQKRESTLLEVTKRVLQSLLLPLEAAPVEQLHLVDASELQRNPEPVLAQACAFLGMGPNPAGATEALPGPTQTPSTSWHIREWEARSEKLAVELGLDAPWPPQDRDSDGVQNGLSPEELHWLETLLAPLEDWWVQGAGLAQAPSEPMDGDLGPLRPLQELVTALIKGLEHHGFKSQGK
jgi:glycosyltransferase involved in cell wall biosynthesis